MSAATARSARPPAGVRLVAGVVLAVVGAACVANPEKPQTHSPWFKVQRLLAIDFAPAETQESSTALDRALAAPWGELERTRHLQDSLGAASDEPGHRLERLPGKVSDAFDRERARLTHFWQRLPAPPPPDRFAKAIAADLERIGFLLGLERRPLGEISDPKHRTDPNDDRPTVTWWERLRRRILP